MTVQHVPADVILWDRNEPQGNIVTDQLTVLVFPLMGNAGCMAHLSCTTPGCVGEMEVWPYSGWIYECPLCHAVVSARWLAKN